MRSVIFALLLFSFGARAQMPDSFPIETFKVYASLLSTSPKQTCYNLTFLPKDLRKSPKECRAAAFRALDQCIRQDRRQGHRPDKIGSQGEYKTLVTDMRSCTEAELTKAYPATPEPASETAGEAAAEPEKPFLISFNSRYISALAADTAKVQALAQRIRKDDRSLCSHYKGSEQSGCLREVLKEWKISSAAALATLGVQVPLAGLRDRKAGMPEKKKKLWMAENMTVLLESVQPGQFLVSELPASGPADEVAKENAQTFEYQELQKVRAKFLQLIAESLSAFPARSIASPDKDQSQALNIRSRCQTIKNMNWRFP